MKQKTKLYTIPVRVEAHIEDTIDVDVEATTRAEAREKAESLVWDIWQARPRSGAVIERHAAVA